MKWKILLILSCYNECLFFQNLVDAHFRFQIKIFGALNRYGLSLRYTSVHEILSSYSTPFQRMWIFKSKQLNLSHTVLAFIGHLEWEGASLVCGRKQVAVGLYFACYYLLLTSWHHALPTQNNIYVMKPEASRVRLVPLCSLYSPASLSPISSSARKGVNYWIFIRAAKEILCFPARLAWLSTGWAGDGAMERWRKPGGVSTSLGHPSLSTKTNSYVRSGLRPAVTPITANHGGGREEQQFAPPSKQTPPIAL